MTDADRARRYRANKGAATWPESLDMAALRNEAGIAGDTDLIATLDRLGL